MRAEARRGRDPLAVERRGKMALVGAVAWVACLLAPAAVAQGAERSGKQVVDASCIACHGSGANGAPRIGDKAAWSKRASQGLTSLTATALQGIRGMPAHGGNPNLTDLEIERAITYMVNQSGGQWIEPSSRTNLAAARSGEQIVAERCVKCHQSGEGGAPRIGDRAAWIPRVKQGLDAVVRSAINGHGGMPARGGQADLTDAELRSAIVYMMNPASVPAPAGSAPAAASGQDYRVLGGTSVFLGVIPVEAIRGSPQQYPQKLYGTPPIGPDQVYVTIALFDTNTARRVPDAEVRARVTTATAAGPEKTLTPVAVDGTPTYGNYFAMGGSGPYDITVRIKRPGAPDSIEAHFPYARR